MSLMFPLLRRLWDYANVRDAEMKHSDKLENSRRKSGCLLADWVYHRPERPSSIELTLHQQQQTSPEPIDMR